MTKIQSVRVLSAAKVNGVLYGILGLLLAPFVLLGPGIAMAGGERHGFGGAVVLAVFLPLIYACVGFVAGALLAFIYNAISHAIGGIEVELLFSSPAIETTPSPEPRLEVPPNDQTSLETSGPSNPE